MKQTIKDYLFLLLVIISFAIVIYITLIPVLYINSLLFAILYFIIPCPLIMLGIYKIVAKLYYKIK